MTVAVGASSPLGLGTEDLLDQVVLKLELAGSSRAGRIEGGQDGSDVSVRSGL